LLLHPAPQFRLPVLSKQLNQQPRVSSGVGAVESSAELDIRVVIFRVPSSRQLLRLLEAAVDWGEA